MKCKKCEREFINERYLKEHVALHHPKPVKPAKEPKVKTPKAKSKSMGNEWVKWVAGRWQMTKKYTKQLELEGEDVALDGLGNYMSVHDLEAAASDFAHDDDRMTEVGIPRYHVLRECAADAIYDGMMKGKARAIAEGRNLDVRRY